ncbi:MAG: glycosyltransferase [Thermoplasmataceae archaeon]
MKQHTTSIVLAVINEIDCLPKIIDGLNDLITSNKINFVNDIIIVDDGSTDGTLDYVKSISGISSYPNIKLISRNQKMGTVDAQLIGIKESSSEYICIMDSDGQHPLEKLPELFSRITDDFDVIVASRYIKGGANNWKATRGIISRGATILSKMFFKGARRLKDPMSGFFIVKRTMVENLVSIKFGYKLLLYIVSANPEAKIVEIPIRMNAREDGESKVVGKSVDFIIKFFNEMIKYKMQSNTIIRKRRKNY